MIKLLIGGSPCTKWSIAQKNNRETKPSGIGWELFKNYLNAKEKFKPDLFLYENNKSAAQPIKTQISKELGVDLMYINSALVSAQNRQRFYAFNWKVEQPQDRGILLADILESGQDLCGNEKSYCLTASYDGAVVQNTLSRKQRTMVAEPVKVGAMPRPNGELSISQAFRVYSIYGKSTTINHGGGGAGGKTGLYAVPVMFQNPHGFNKGGIKYDKAPTMTATGSYTSNNFVIDEANVAIPINPLQSEKARCLTAGYANKGLQHIHILESNFSDDPHKQTWDSVAEQTLDDVAEEKQTGKRIYTVENGEIEIKGRLYPINLPDGCYIIRKLTVTECCRLQTLPDDYCRAVSPTQAYKGLGNGWTAEVIIHILNGALKDIPRDEEILCLSMYDGIGTGRYCLDKMGFTNVRYYAYEIDKFAMKIANSNYPDIIQCGDAFNVRKDDWKIGG